MSSPGWLRHRPRVALLAAFVALAPACSLLGTGTDPAAEKRDADLRRGLRAWEEGRHEAALRALRSARAGCGMEGERCVRIDLLVAGLWLDPTHPGASPDRAARLTAPLLLDPELTPELRARARALYLLALELGARTPAVGTPVVGTSADSLPALSRPSLAERYAALRGRAERLEEEGIRREAALERLRAVRDSLAEEVVRLQEELERIRKALKP